MKGRKIQSGFTLIDLLIYIAIVSLMLTTLIPFAWNIIESSVKNSVQEDLSSSARYVSERILYEIRNAKDIDTVNSNFDLNLASNQTKKIVLVGQSGNVQLSIINGILQITNNSQTDSLNPTTTKITNLTFSNYSNSKTKHLMFTLTIQESYTTARQEYNASTTIQTSGEIRSN